MNESLEEFLNNSSIAEKVRITPRIVVQRMFLKPRDLVDIRKRRHYGPVSDKEKICELEAGGQVLARGKIIRRRGEYYFKVLETFEAEEET